jgi:hypothetical protein
MLTAPRGLALAAGFAMSVMAVSPAAAKTASVTCASGRTLAGNGTVRVFGIDPHPHDSFTFKENYRAYACLTSRHRVRRLGLYVSGGAGEEYGPYRFAVGGRFVAFDAAECDRESCSQSVVKVVDVRSGAVKRAPLAPEGALKVSDIVVKANGSIAWIRAVGGGARVERMDSTGYAVLDPGPAVKDGSLALAHSTVYWTSGGTATSAALR